MTLQQAPYLREQRQFPNDDVKLLSNQMDHTYIDIAAKVNARTIGLFANNFQIISGETWYLAGSSEKKQGLRQVYPFTAVGTIAHGINFNDVFKFTHPFGSFTDGTNWYGAIWASNVAIAGQISFYVDPTNIVILAGAGAPAITSGIIVLEWISSTGA
jgi:hypothetical protein